MTSAFAPNTFGMDGRYAYMPPAQAAFFPEDDSPMVSPDIYGPQLHQLNTLSTESLPHYSDYDDSSLGLLSPLDGPTKAKRRQHGVDHIKHKRTRSGCYTCRQRRVKCDEIHPTCERCRKGKRECIYPDPSAQKTGRDLSKIRSVPADSGSNSSADEAEMDSQRLSPILDEQDEARAGVFSSEPSSAIEGPTEGIHFPAHDSMSPRSKDREPISPTDSIPKSVSRRPQPSRQSSRQYLRQAQFSGPKWAKLPKDIRFYIKYHRENITCNHYSLKHDGTDFLKTTFLEIALSYEPLLYAITAFSAYFHTLTLPNGKISMFLRYYDKSVQTLRESLSKSPRHSPATLLTILQLATFEEFLGDWVNVMAHQSAAHEILTQLFTPENIMQNETRRKIIAWYLRFDIVTGLISANETVLGREWHCAVSEYYNRQEADRPKDLGCIFEANFAKSRLLATDITHLFARKGKGAISDDDFTAGLAELRQRVSERDDEVNNAFADSRTYVTEFPLAPPAGSEARTSSIVDATAPDFILAGDLWTWNLILSDWWAIKLVFLGQNYQLDPTTVNPLDMVECSYKICRLFEGFEWSGAGGPPDSPPASPAPQLLHHHHSGGGGGPFELPSPTPASASAMLGVYGSLGIAATALPKDPRHALWCRRKFAIIERCGYVYPPSFRERMSDIWSADVTQWWLPDGHGCLPILRAIREFVDYRTAHPSTNPTKGLGGMAAIMESVKFVEGGGGHEREHGSSSGGGGSSSRATSSVGSSAALHPDGLGFGASTSTAGGGAGFGLAQVEETGGHWRHDSPEIDWSLVTSGEVAQGEWGQGSTSPAF